MTIETIIVLTVFGLLFLVLPVGTLIIKRHIPPKLMALYGGLASVAVMALILYRAFFVTAAVPKPRYHDEGPIKVSVIEPVQPAFLKAVAERWVPACEYEFVAASADLKTGCTPINPDPYEGEFTAVEGPRDEDPFVRYSVAEVEGMYYDGEDEVPMGKMSKGCVVAPWSLDDDDVPTVDGQIGMIWGHELAHLCGYAHAVGDPTNPDVRLHLMSRSIQAQGDDVEGLDYGNTQMYVPTIE